jgi:hypothetical protein
MTLPRGQQPRARLAEFPDLVDPADLVELVDLVDLVELAGLAELRARRTDATSGVASGHRKGRARGRVDRTWRYSTGSLLVWTAGGMTDQSAATPKRGTRERLGQ